MNLISRRPFLKKVLVVTLLLAVTYVGYDRLSGKLQNLGTEKQFNAWVDSLYGIITFNEVEDRYTRKEVNFLVAPPHDVSFTEAAYYDRGGITVVLTPENTIVDIGVWNYWLDFTLFAADTVVKECFKSYVADMQSLSEDMKKYQEDSTPRPTCVSLYIDENTATETIDSVVKFSYEHGIELVNFFALSSDTLSYPSLPDADFYDTLATISREWSRAQKYTEIIKVMEPQFKRSGKKVYELSYWFANYNFEKRDSVLLHEMKSAMKSEHYKNADRVATFLYHKRLYGRAQYTFTTFSFGDEGYVFPEGKTWGDVGGELFASESAVLQKPEKEEAPE